MTAPTNADYFAAINVLRNGSDRPQGWTVLSTLANPATGFNGIAFKNSAGQVIVAFQGPVPVGGTLGAGALQTDVGVLNGNLSPGYRADVSSFMKGVADVAGQSMTRDNVFVTGNSLGGVAAQLAAQTDGFGGAAYGAPGVPGNLNNPQPSNFLLYSNARDPVANFASGESGAPLLAPSQANSMYHYGQVVPLGTDGQRMAFDYAVQTVSHPTGTDADAGLMLPLLSGIGQHSFESYGAALGVPVASPPAVPPQSDGLDMLMLPFITGQNSSVGGAAASVDGNGAVTLTRNYADGLLASQDTYTANPTGATAGEFLIKNFRDNSGAPLPSTRDDIKIANSGQIVSDAQTFNPATASEVSETKSTTTSDGTRTAIQRDLTGSGQFGQSETIGRDTSGNTLTDNLTNADGSSVHVSDSYANGTATAFVSATDASGLATNFTLSGTAAPEVLVAANGQSLSAPNTGNAVLIGDGGTTLTAGGGPEVLIAFGAANTITAGAGAAVYLSGTSDFVNDSGGTVSLGAGDSNITITGSNDSITLGSGSSTNLNATAGTASTGDVITNDAVGNLVNIGGNVSATFAGASGGGIGIYGTDIVVAASGENVLLTANTQANITGGNDAITLSIGSSTNLNATAGTTSTGDVITNDAVGNLVNIGGNVSATFAGASGGGIGIYGTDIVVAASGENVLLTANTQANITGGNDAITLSIGSSTNLNATAGTTSTGDVITNDAVGNLVNIGGNVSATFAGASGGGIGIYGTDIVVAASGENVLLTANTQANITGGNDAITLSIGSSTNLNATAGTTSTGDVITNDAVGNLVNIGGNVSATFAGASGGGIGIYGTDIVVAASGENVLLTANTQANITGSNDGLTLSSGSIVGLVGGSGNLVTNDNAGDTVNLVNGASATVNGSGGSIGVFGSDSVITSNETINFTAGPGNAIALTGGSGNVVSDDNAGDVVNLVNGASATVNGSGGSIGVFGSDSVITSNETINFTAGPGNAIALTGGSGNVVSDDNAGDVVNLVNGASATVNGSGGSIGVFGSDSVITSNETINFTAGPGNAIALTGGSGNVVSDDNAGDVVNLMNGASATVNGSGGSIGVLTWSQIGHI